MNAPNLTPCPFCTVPIPLNVVVCPSCEHKLPPPVDIKAVERKLEEWRWRIGVFRPFADWFINSLLLVGVLGQLSGVLLGFGADRYIAEAPWFLLVGTLILCLSLTLHAKIKFRSWAWGMMGFLSIIGIGVVLVLLRPRCLKCGGLKNWYVECPRCDREESRQ